MRFYWLLLLSLNVVLTSQEVATIYQVPIEDHDDNMYLVKLQIGTPPQNFTLQLDSSTADFWVSKSKHEFFQCVKFKTCLFYIYVNL